MMNSQLAMPRKQLEELDQICTDMLLNPMVVGDTAFVSRLSGPRGLPGRKRTNAPSSSRAGGDSDGLSTADGVKIKLPAKGQHSNVSLGPVDQHILYSSALGSEQLSPLLTEPTFRGLPWP